MTAPFPLDVPRFTAPALCAEADPDAWHPVKGGSPRAAKRVCARCPARDECLTYALDHRLINQHDGIWGGLTWRERRAMVDNGQEAA